MKVYNLKISLEICMLQSLCLYIEIYTHIVKKLRNVPEATGCAVKSSNLTTKF